METDDRMACQKPHEVRIYNQRLILSHLQRKPYTVKQLSTLTGLSATSIMKSINYLKERGMVGSIGKGSSTGEGGKRPDLYLVNRHYKYALSCFISNDSGIILSTDYLNKKVSINKFNFDITCSFEEVAGLVADKIYGILRQNKLSADQICGIAIAFDGVVSSVEGIIKYPVHNLNWGTDIKALAIFKELLPDISTILIGNSSRLAAYEILDYNYEYRNKSIYVIGTGADYAGGCLLDHGSAKIGSHGLLGEVGHTIGLDPERNEEVRFENTVGNRFLITSAITMANEAHQSEEIELLNKLEDGRANIRDILVAADNSNIYAQKVIRPIIKSFATLIRNIELLCDPDLIVIYGIYALGGEYFKTQIINELGKSVLHTLTGGISFELLPFREEFSYCLGATQYIIDQDIQNEIS